MIQHTLLPDNEIKALRNEYRIRLAIILLFFISCSIVIGMFVLFPSFIRSYSGQDEAVRRANELEKNRQANGIEDIKKNLAQSQFVAEKIINNRDNVFYSDIIQNIISHKSKEILIDSFGLSSVVGTSTPVEVIVQGKALTRESLVTFKKNLEKDSSSLKVELPVSDLTKSKNTSFALRLIVKKQDVTKDLRQKVN